MTLSEPCAGKYNRNAFAHLVWKMPAMPWFGSCFGNSDPQRAQQPPVGIVCFSTQNE